LPVFLPAHRNLMKALHEKGEVANAEYRAWKKSQKKKN
jgi:hypothetical protein